jgi:dTDP-4-amino-4,6-dideoxygalactose transaminase
VTDTLVPGAAVRAVDGGTPLVPDGATFPALYDRDALADDIAGIVRAGATFAWYGGPRQQAFERAFAGLVDAPHAVMCSSGTMALAILLQAFGAGPGRTVAIPSFTYHSVLSAVLHARAEPFLCATDPDTLLIDVDRAVAEIPAGAVLVAVHAGGRPLDVPELRRRRPDLLVIEDAAEAQGTLLRGRQVGNDGVAAMWSFTTSHNDVHTAAVGGMVTTADPQLAVRVRQLAHYGKPHRSTAAGTPMNPYPAEPGHNGMTSELEAAYGLATAAVAREAWARRRSTGAALRDAIADAGFRTPRTPAGGEENFYDVFFHAGVPAGRTRDWVVDALIAERLPAWSYSSLYALPWLERELRARGAWTARDAELAPVERVRCDTFAIRPSLHADSIPLAALAVRRVFAPTEEV